MLSRLRLTNENQEPVEVFAGLLEGTKVVPFDQLKELFGLGIVNLSCYVHDRTVPLTVAGEQLP